MPELELTPEQQNLIKQEVLALFDYLVSRDDKTTCNITFDNYKDVSKEEGQDMSPGLIGKEAFEFYKVELQTRMLSEDNPNGIKLRRPELYEIDVLPLDNGRVIAIMPVQVTLSDDKVFWKKAAFSFDKVSVIKPDVETKLLGRYAMDEVAEGERKKAKADMMEALKVVVSEEAELRLGLSMR